MKILAPLESPILTGIPTAPTASAGTNTTQIATTAFVQNAVSSAGIEKGTVLPTAGAAYRGQLFYIQSPSGTADKVYICIKLANDTY